MVQKEALVVMTRVVLLVMLASQATVDGVAMEAAAEADVKAVHAGWQVGMQEDTGIVA